MTTIEEAAAILQAGRTPVICLDTCDFLDVVRGIAEGNLFHAKSFRTMRDTLAVTPDRFRPVITYLVRHEWEQNKREYKVWEKVKKHLEETANSVRRIAEAREIGGLPILTINDNVFDDLVVRNLFQLAEEVMGQAIEIERNSACVSRALERVMEKRRPSHKNEIKDSIHWEHYLELSRQLVNAGHDQHRYFVSANKADFWADVRSPQLHPELTAEAKSASLAFSGKLDEALRALGV